MMSSTASQIFISSQTKVRGREKDREKDRKKIERERERDDH